MLLFFILPVQTSIYNIFHPKSLTFLTRLRLGLAHLNEHTYHQFFQYCLNLVSSSSLEIGDTSHYISHYYHFSHHPVVLMKSAKSICNNFEPMPNKVKEDLLLCGDSRFDENKNEVILKVFIKNTERFSRYLFDKCFITG